MGIYNSILPTYCIFLTKIPNTFYVTIHYNINKATVENIAKIIQQWNNPLADITYIFKSITPE